MVLSKRQHESEEAKQERMRELAPEIYEALMAAERIFGRDLDDVADHRCECDTCQWQRSLDKIRRKVEKL